MERVHGGGEQHALIGLARAPGCAGRCGDEARFCAAATPTPGQYYCVSGKVNSADKLYLVIESLKPVIRPRYAVRNIRLGPEQRLGGCRDGSRYSRVRRENNPLLVADHRRRWQQRFALAALENRTAKASRRNRATYRGMSFPARKATSRSAATNYFGETKTGRSGFGRRSHED
jgi:hypothetical protein